MELAIAAVIVLTTLLIGVICFVQVRKRLTALRPTARHSAQAKTARESDELDLDSRLGTKRFIAITTDAGTFEVAYRQIGAGPDIICVHGIGASMIIYRRLVPWLSGNYRVTCLDFPGFGSSTKLRSLSYTLDEQATHLDLAIKALKLNFPLVIGSSMGAAITLRAAIEHPSSMRGIVALGPAVDPKRVPFVLLPLAKYGHHLHRMNSQLAVRTALYQVMERRELITPALVSLYQEPFLDRGDSSSALLKALGLLADSRMPQIFSALQTPLLIVRGLRDRLVKQSACEDLHRIVKNSQFITHPTAGHHIMEDEPMFVAHEVRKFDAPLNAHYV